MISMIIVENVFPTDRAESIRKAFMEAKFRPVHQTSDGMDVDYSCSFKNSNSIGGSEEAFNGIVREIAVMFSKATDINWSKVRVMAYKMTEGDYFRSHTDERNGRGFIYYLSKGWQWDWGGILMANIKDKMTPFIPVFNQMLIVDYKCPHFVTPVMPYAKEPRYALVGFGK